MPGSHGTHCHDAQEKPDFAPHPDEGADGSDEPELILKLPAEMSLLTFSLLHLLH
jgi:hypothetical protein